MNYEMDLSFVAVGPQRTGTTWIYEMLRGHPQIFVPEDVKETMFFDRRYNRGIDWYVQYYEGSREDQLHGEVAPTYFDIPEVPGRIYEVSPSCSIIVSLRHPAERAFSLYLHHLRKGRVPNDFHEAIKQKPRILKAGRYATHVPRWQSVFGKERTHFLFLDDIKNHPLFVLDQVCRWLSVPSINGFSRASEKVYAASMPRFPLLARGAAALTTFFHSCGLHSVVEAGKRLGLREFIFAGEEERMPELSSEDRRSLIQEYKSDIDFVESTTGRELTHWRE